MPSRSTFGEGHADIDVWNSDVGLPGLEGTACQERTRSESSEPLAGRLGAPAQRGIALSRLAVKSRCAREWGGWGRLSDDGPGQNNPDPSEGPWGKWSIAPHGGAPSGLRPDTERTTVATTRCTKGGCKLDRWSAYAGSRLKLIIPEGHRLEQPAFQPYRGKPAVRNDRGDRGNVGIIRSPFRALILPDRRIRSQWCQLRYARIT